MRNLLKNFNFKFLSIGLICSLLVHSIIIFILFSLIKTKKSQEIVSFVELVPYSEISSLPEIDRLQEQLADENAKFKNEEESITPDTSNSNSAETQTKESSLKKTSNKTFRNSDKSNIRIYFF